jgi:hypothetical protein
MTSIIFSLLLWALAKLALLLMGAFFWGVFGGLDVNDKRFGAKGLIAIAFGMVLTLIGGFL